MKFCRFEKPTNDTKSPQKMQKSQSIITFKKKKKQLCVIATLLWTSTEWNNRAALKKKLSLSFILQLHVNTVSDQSCQGHLTAVWT